MKLIPSYIRENQIANTCKGSIYSFVRWVGNYKGNRTPVVMKCELHGEWTMYLPDLFRNVRCAACKNVRNLKEEEVLNRIEKACKGKHFKFTRWESEYKNIRSKAVFSCESHGEWVTQYTCITNSDSGCPSCSKNGFDVSQHAFLYCMKSADGQKIKVGVTNNISRRIVELKRSTPFEFEMIAILENESGSLILSLEKVFHNQFDNAMLEGFNGATEWLKWNPEIPLWFDYLNCKSTHTHSQS